MNKALWIIALIIVIALVVIFLSGPADNAAPEENADTTATPAMNDTMPAEEGAMHSDATTTDAGAGMEAHADADAAANAAL